MKPRVSVVVPVHDSGKDLGACLDALQRSDLRREEWELIVVDDSSTDASADIASGKSDRLLRLSGGPHGPAFARNRGAENARGSIVAFVDADVEVHPDALGRMVRDLDEASVTAVFGSYDTTPADPGFVSQFRNLLHHRVHHESAGPVESFWAGCGAMRKDAFESAGGFDERRFRRPEMEDVELGYRLRDRGENILLDPAVLCTHRKRWTLPGMVKSDFARRGVPWTELLLERGNLLSPRGPSLGRSQRLSVVTAALVGFTAVIAALIQTTPALLFLASSVALFIGLNWALLAFLHRERGLWFAVRSIPLYLLYNFVAISALGYGIVRHAQSERAREL